MIYFDYMKESDFQAKVIRWLRSQKCVVMKYQQNATTHAGLVDLFFVKDGFWGAAELKKSKTAKFRPGQKEMIKKLDAMSWCKAIYPENFNEVKKELEDLLRD